MMAVAKVTPDHLVSNVCAHFQGILLVFSGTLRGRVQGRCIWMWLRLCRAIAKESSLDSVCLGVFPEAVKHVEQEETEQRKVTQ